MTDDTSPTPPSPKTAQVPEPSLLQVLARLWRSVNERKMVQWTIAYVALAYSLQHGVQLTSDAFKWEGVTGISMLLLALGLPLVVTVAWYHGERGSQRISGPELTIISTLFVIGALLFVVFVRPAGESIAPAVQQAGIAGADRQPAAQAGTISVAVLPFLNLSSDAEQEFFSDGMTEEITSALAKVPGLTVIGRTSAFEFKGQNKDLRMIGQALGTTHLIEGSVRKAGTRVRITAQLIRADNGAHLWTENYDRELTDVFAIQEDIATAIAAALRVPLGLKPGETLITSRLADPEIYEQYLRFRSRNFRATLATWEAFVARAPGFAPGWAALAGAYRGDAAAAGRRGDVKTGFFLLDKEEAAARKAIQLDASYAGGYSELAGVQTKRGKWAEADDLYKQALALDPNDSELLNIYSQTLFAEGHLKEALRVRERLQALEPLALDQQAAAYKQITARIMLANGQIDTSIAILEPDPATGARRNIYLAEAYAMKGRFGDAADTLLRITSEIDRRSVEDAAQLLRSAPRKTDQPAKLPALVGELGFIYLYVGAPERMLEFPEKAREEGAFMVPTVWGQTAAPLRKTERFKALVRKVGLVDYWRARGWPDLCRPMGANDFVCD